MIDASRVIFEINHEVSRDEYDQEHSYIESVTPNSLALICPYCKVFASVSIKQSVRKENWEFDLICSCPSCSKTVFAEVEFIDDPTADACQSVLKAIYPKTKVVNVPKEIPVTYAQDYREAILVLKDSPKASAALSRRILQNVLRNELGIAERSLDQEIDKFVKLEGVPSYLSDAVDAVRTIGNIAAHPSKNENTGEIVDVESGEAEWLLEVIDSLCDFAFVQPERLRARREALNEKLQVLGKPSLKERYVP